MKKKPELLIPASSLEVLKTAVIFGADAVYIGGDAFGLRAKAKNFSKEEMAEGISFAHEHGVKVHVTVNMGMCLRLLPITGVPLPLISSGGTFLIVMMTYLGVVQSVYAHRNQESFLEV